MQNWMSKIRSKLEGMPLDEQTGEANSREGVGFHGWHGRDPVELWREETESMVGPSDEDEEFPDPFSHEDPDEEDAPTGCSTAEDDGPTVAQVWGFIGSESRVQEIGEYLKSESGNEPITDDEKKQVRREAMSLVSELDIEPDLEYDCVPCPNEIDGVRTDIYVIRGCASALDRFSNDVSALGAALAETPPHVVDELTYAAGVFRDIENERTFVEKPAPPPVVRKSPSDMRYRLRHKYGVRRSQLIKYGLPPVAAGYISAKIKENLLAGIDIVLVIELAQEELLIGEDSWVALDRYYTRRAAGLTVPRMIRDGCPRDEAFFVVHKVEMFLEAGADLLFSFNTACALWDGLKQGGAGAQAALDYAAGLLTETRYNTLFAGLTGEGASEVDSGAGWVARVASALCLENNPKTGRFYSMDEALAQTFGEWSNMTRAARLLVRCDYHQEDIRKNRDRTLSAGEGAERDERWFAEAWIRDYLKVDPLVDADQVVLLAAVHARDGVPLEAAANAAVVEWEDANRPKTPSPAFPSLESNLAGPLRLYGLLLDILGDIPRYILDGIRRGG